MASSVDDGKRGVDFVEVDDVSSSQSQWLRLETACIMRAHRNLAHSASITSCGGNVSSTPIDTMSQLSRGFAQGATRPLTVLHGDCVNSPDSVSGEVEVPTSEGPVATGGNRILADGRTPEDVQLPVPNNGILWSRGISIMFCRKVCGSCGECSSPPF